MPESGLWIWIPVIFPGRNEQEAAARTHRQKAAKMKKDFTAIVRLYSMPALRRYEKEYHPWDPNLQYEPTFEWVEKNRRRDPDNIAAGCKFILDGLQPEILANDGWKQIIGITHIFNVVMKNQSPGVFVALWRWPA